VSRRQQIQMSAAEVAAFLDAQRVVICASRGPRGWPHLMPLWYVVRDGHVWTWTYAKSQKVRNLERDPRATLQVEDGEVYQELRGVMIEAQAVIQRDADTVIEFGVELLTRYGRGATGSDFMDFVRASAAKRVALEFSPQRTASWDHRKLGGVY
jgi:PPOX class probable F420-dependent enzyme